MNGADFKQIEGQRLQQVLGAIGALPAALLVFGDGPATSASGAPLFVFAIASGISALVFMTYTDGVFYLDSSDFNLSETHQQEWDAFVIQLEKFGHYTQAFSLLYACSSLVISILGIAGVYSSLKSNISIEMGFLTAIILTVVLCIHVAWGRWKMNVLTQRSRDISENDRGTTPIHCIMIVPPTAKS